MDLHHGAAHDDRSESGAASARNARIGRVLFVVYLALYLGYMWLIAFGGDLAKLRPMGGVNLAVLYGFGLIVAAFVTALLYGWLCRARSPTSGDAT